MLKTVRKKFKNKELQDYMEGKWFKQWAGIKTAEKVRRRIKFVNNTRDIRDFSAFSGFRLEKIKGTKNYYSIRTGSGQWRIFFIWENNEAWEIDLNKHDYKQIKRGK